MDESQDAKGDYKRPSLFWLVTEAGRAVTEMGLSLPYRRLTGYDHSSDGHPVVVLPGFMASSNSTAPLRKFINKLGYTSLDWGLGRNYAKEEYIEILADKIEKLYEKFNQQITLIGWSLGGVYARQIGKLAPDKVRQIITLGSPFQGISKPNNVAWIYNILNGGKKPAKVNPELLKNIPKPAPVPTTAIYSKQDGIVPWQLCMEDEDHKRQNIEVKGSHLGLGVNYTVLRIIASRLPYEKHEWVPLDIENNGSDELVLSPSM